jgi:hypothetical protein
MPWRSERIKIMRTYSFYRTRYFQSIVVHAPHTVRITWIIVQIKNARCIETAFNV